MNQVLIKQVFKCLIIYVISNYLMLKYLQLINFRKIVKKAVVTNYSK